MLQPVSNPGHVLTLETSTVVVKIWSLVVALLGLKNLLLWSSDNSGSAKQTSAIGRATLNPVVSEVGAPC